jgi:hypothetical protein
VAGSNAVARSAEQELVKAIIRPPRAEYDLTHLGPRNFEFCGKRFKRGDFEVRTFDPVANLNPPGGPQNYQYHPLFGSTTCRRPMPSRS